MQVSGMGYRHVELDDEQDPMVAGTTMKVIELVLEHLVNSWTAEELHFQFPHLTLEQIYSALAYFSDHKDWFDRDIERRLKEVGELRGQNHIAPLVERLKAQGLLKGRKGAFARLSV